MKKKRVPLLNHIKIVINYDSFFKHANKWQSADILFMSFFKFRRAKFITLFTLDLHRAYKCCHSLFFKAHMKAQWYSVDKFWIFKNILVGMFKWYKFSNKLTLGFENIIGVKNTCRPLSGQVSQKMYILHSNLDNVMIHNS